ncbi:MULTISPECIES: PH domain-containing protein [unclassified Ruminococcus]|uniref:PH domain-containing protein n=1 Tax=unclassified Ruminococcus TaxID=2608920 RepID=UPI00210D67E7|nr:MULTISPECIES: PH domain-containing protein [unclassified Ruminococcus]MCQ4021480.1 PH domain-containing protein [Ruminococcus sp. zg-924]MCQ4113925.1 PH domain-containing protein [Ruminococcus sp. zg-921]
MIIEASKKYALLLQLKAAALLVLLAFLSGAIAAVSFVFAAVFGFSALAVYIFTALYIKRFADSLSVRTQSSTMIIKQGVIIRKTAVVPLAAVRYCKAKRTPLSRLFGICTVSVFTSSGKVLIYGLSFADAEKIISCAEENKFEKAE